MANDYLVIILPIVAIVVVAIMMLVIYFLFFSTKVNTNNRRINDDCKLQNVNNATADSTKNTEDCTNIIKTPEIKPKYDCGPNPPTKLYLPTLSKDTQDDITRYKKNTTLFTHETIKRKRKTKYDGKSGNLIDVAMLREHFNTNYERISKETNQIQLCLWLIRLHDEFSSSLFLAKQHNIFTPTSDAPLAKDDEDQKSRQDRWQLWFGFLDAMLNDNETEHSKLYQSIKELQLKIDRLLNCLFTTDPPQTTPKDGAVGDKGAEKQASGRKRKAANNALLNALNAWITQNNVSYDRDVKIKSYPSFKHDTEIFRQAITQSTPDCNEFSEQEQQAFIQQSDISQILRDFETAYNANMRVQRDDIDKMASLIALYNDIHAQLYEDIPYKDPKDRRLIMQLLKDKNTEYHKLHLLIKDLETEIDRLIANLMPENVRDYLFSSRA